MMRLFWRCWLALSLTTGLFFTHAAHALESNPELKIAQPEQGKLVLEIRFAAPVAELSFIVPQALAGEPATSDGGRTWTYSIEIAKIGSQGVTAAGLSWGVFPLTLVLPEAALDQLQSLRLMNSEAGSQARVGQYILLGPGWKSTPATDTAPKLYYVNASHRDDYLSMIEHLVASLKTWNLTLPRTLPTFLFYEHNLADPVYSGVNEHQILAFLIPRSATKAQLHTQGAPVLGHELMHLYTGKGDFEKPYALNSSDPILREGFLTYAGLILAHEAGELSDVEFEAYLQHIRALADAVAPVLLRPVQKSSGWTRLAYFRGALLAHELNLALAPEHDFKALFKRLVEHPGPLQTEDLPALIAEGFHKDVTEIVERFLTQPQP